MKKQVFLYLVALLILLNGVCNGSEINWQVLVILNSKSTEASKSREYLMPYLDHFGIPFNTLDLADKKLPVDLKIYNLIILSHKGISTTGTETKKKLIENLKAASASGTGILSFEPELFTESGTESRKTFIADALVYNNGNHYITSLHKFGEKLKLFGTMQIPEYENVSGEILLSCQGNPVLWAFEADKARIVNWATMEWMDTKVLGPLGGLDDCLWRSMVWAARKPFVMRGLPPLVTMRVDDVAGRGELWQKDPLYWVNICNKYQLKPWLGLFIYNLTPKTVDELRGYIQTGQATASPHALGRPPRDNKANTENQSYSGSNQDRLNARFFYNPKSCYRTGRQDFIKIQSCFMEP
jgi:hypothetical protein